MKLKKLKEFSYTGTGLKKVKAELITFIRDISIEQKISFIDAAVLVRTAVDDPYIMNVLRGKQSINEDLNNSDMDRIRGLIRKELADLMLDLFKKRYMWI